MIEEATARPDLLTRRGGKTWWYDFTVAHKRFRASTRTTDKRLAALKAGLAYRQAFTEHACSIPAAAPKQRMTLKDAAARWWDEYASRTAAGRRSQKYHLPRIIDLLGGDKDLSSIADADIARMLAALEAEGAGPATVNRYLTTLVSIATRAEELWNVAPRQWTARKHRRKEPDAREAYLTRAEAARLADAVVAHARAPILLDLMTGLRRANILGLRWEEVDLDARRLSLRQKGDRRLVIDLTADAVALLTALAPNPADRVGAVFRYANPAVGCTCPHCLSPAYRGQPIRDIRRAFATAKRRAGIIKPIRFHDLRHTLASWLLEATGNLRLVQSALGHARITTTTRYAHLTGEARRDGLERATAGLVSTT